MKPILPILALLFGLFAASSAIAQPTIVTSEDTIKVMQYNLLRFPGTTVATRLPLLIKVLRYTKPHIFTINEMSVEAGGDIILNQALNINGETRWARGKFIGGMTPYNMIFYRSDLFGHLFQDSIQTVPRYTRGSRMYYKDPALGGPLPIDTTYFDIYQMHLLSSQGTSQEASRNVQCQALVSRLTNIVRDSNVIVTGDFNLYRSAEAAYQTLLGPGPFKFIDPINRPGAWSANAAFADIHTQSPRTAQFGGGAFGGMDDRFDFIMTTTAMQTGSHRMRNLPATYTAVGNDGNHFNGALTTLPNGQVPDSIALALHDLSDHLPVTMKVVITKRSIVVGLPKALAAIGLEASNPNPTGFKVANPALAQHWQLINNLGQVVSHGTIDANNVWQPLPTQAPRTGVYQLIVTGSNGAAYTKVVWY